MNAVHVVADVTYYSADRGGRKTPILANLTYRPQFHIDDADWDARQTFPQLSEGDVVITEHPYEVWFEFSNLDHTSLKCGQTFQIREGAKVVGAGTITRVNPCK